MMGAEDIGWGNLAAGYVLLFVPLLIFRYYRTGMIRSTLVSMARMSVQLLLVALYLEVIFRLNNPWLNTGWVTVMILATAWTVIGRVRLSPRYLFVPVFLAVLFSLTAVDAYLLGAVLRLNFIFDARYFIPITGMLIGNSLTAVIVSFDSFFGSLTRQQTTYRFGLANGATRQESLRMFIREAIRRAMNPTIASTAVMGLVSLPGMMTGQILGGSDPSVAIKYQILIMISIFVSTLLSLVISLNLCSRFVFDRFDNLKSSVFRR